MGENTYLGRPLEKLPLSKLRCMRCYHGDYFGCQLVHKHWELDIEYCLWKEYNGISWWNKVRRLFI